MGDPWQDEGFVGDDGDWEEESGSDLEEEGVLDPDELDDADPWDDESGDEP